MQVRREHIIPDYSEESMTNASVASSLRRLSESLASTSHVGSMNGLAELWDILMRDAVIDEPDSQQLRVQQGIATYMCADPDRNHDMEKSLRTLCAGCGSHGERMSPLKTFGGPLILLDESPALKLGVSTDADADAMAQMLLAQQVGGLKSFGLCFHLPCGVATKTGMTRRAVLGAYPLIKHRIRAVWEDSDLPQFEEIVGFLHFDCGNGDMRIGRVAKGRMSLWLARNKRSYPELLDVV